jgi:hypothetical protein
MPANILEAIQALGGSLYFVVTVVLGIRLLVRAYTKRVLPELFLGLSFLLAGTIGSCLEVAGMLAAQEQADPAQVGALLMLGKSIGVVGLACSILFIYWVFRRNERLALVPVVAVIATAVFALAGLIAVGDLTTGVTPAPWFWIELAARAATPCWLGLEAGRYYVRMRRRTRIGLADPVVTNRFLLWTFAAFFGFLMIWTSIPPAVLGNLHPLSHVALASVGLFGAASATCHWLAFFPPEAYQRRLRARAAAQA